VSLRLRLLLVLVALVAAGLLVADAVTYYSLRSFLFQRVDQQLVQAQRPMFVATSGSGPGGFGGGGDLSLPPGTYGQLRATDGTVIKAVSITYGSLTEPVPALPSPLPSVQHSAVKFTSGAAGGSSVRFRVLAQAVPQIGVLIVAIPLTDVIQTLSRLVIVELVVTVAVLVGLAALAWWLVRRELRPLEGMAAAAGRIAAGDLAERVTPAGSRTEVGQLGLALNGMLEQIERAFAQRAATEDKLRRFLADASHELRTPLTSIRGYAEIFRRGAKDDPEDLATAMRRIEEEGGRMGVMVDELLLLARLGEGRTPEHEPVDLARLAEDAVGDARMVDPERPIELQTSGEPVVFGDELQLRQVVGNLVGNALRHTPAGTPVRVTVGENSSGAVLHVADDGPGMPQETAAKAFEPFFRADPSRTRETGGAGLGLAIVAAVVEAHGGQVELTTAPGQGATFTVHLPLGAPATD
jgi:two-component system, OmpR family, sensor kinase